MLTCLVLITGFIFNTSRISMIEPEGKSAAIIYMDKQLPMHIAMSTSDIHLIIRKECPDVSTRR